VSRAVRMLLASALAVLGLGAMAGPASAGIWTEIPSNTADDITAVEYQGADRFWFTTGGKIYRRVGGTFQNVATDAAAGFRDIEFLPAPSLVGLAVGGNGKIYRSTNAGATWNVVPAPNGGHRTDDTNCVVAQPLGDIDSVRFDGQGNPWLLAGGSQIFKSTDGGAGFTYANGGLDCKINQDIDDAFFVPGTAAGYYVAKSFGAVWYSDDLASGSAFEKAADAGNGFQFRRRMTGDPANPQRQWAVFPDDGNGSYFRRTTDGWSSSTGWDVVNESVRSRSATTDVDYAGGTILAAGLAGEVLQSIDGASFFFNGADSPLSSTDWLAVSLADGANGAVAGRGGKLIVTSQANVTPDVVAPTGTIAGPASANAGQPVTFTLNAADTGGSGLNPASIAWTSAGLPGASGNPVQFTFPSPGFYTVKVTFADNAGNTAEATKSITINKAVASSLPVSFTGPGNQLSAKIVGNRVRIRARGTIKLPAGAPRSACRGKIKLTVKRKSTTLAKRSAKLKRKNGKCRFGKTIFIKRSKVGRTTTRLRLKVSFGGNAVLKAGSTTKTLVIKK
jgi:PKD domain